jgi:hypothetical protein
MHDLRIERVFCPQIVVLGHDVVHDAIHRKGALEGGRPIIIPLVMDHDTCPAKFSLRERRVSNSGSVFSQPNIGKLGVDDLAQVRLDALTQKGFGTSRAIGGVISNTSSWVHKVVVGTEMKVEMIIKGSNNEAEGVVVTQGSRARV